MTLKCVWSVFFIALLCSILYNSSAEDIKKLTFRISRKWLRPQKRLDYKCDSDALDTKVGERIMIFVSHNTAVVTNWCAKTDFVNSTINTINGKSGIIISFTKPGAWEYECEFQINGKDFICSATVSVKKDVEPNGYLMANTYNISTTEEEYIYKFQAGDIVNFTCSKNSGNAVSLKITTQDNNITSLLSKNALTKTKDLNAANNNTIVICIISGDKTYKEIKLRLIIHDENTRGTWIIVFCFMFVLVLVLVASGLWIIFRHQIRNRTRKNSPSFVYYQNLPRRQDSSVVVAPSNRPVELNNEFDSLGNSYSKNPNSTQKIAVEELAYLNSHEINNASSYASVQDIEPNYAVVNKSQPNYATVENNLHNNKKGTSGNKQDAAYINQNMTKLQKTTKLNIKDTHTDDIKTKVIKDRKDTQRHRPESKKESDVLYADLALAHPKSHNFAPSKTSNYSEIQKVHRNCTYENANIKNDLEPAYCEIMPTKNKARH